MNIIVKWYMTMTINMYMINRMEYVNEMEVNKMKLYYSIG